MFITRKKLQSFGISQYQARAITKDLVPAERQGKQYCYYQEDVIQSVAQRRQKHRIQHKTREQLIQLETQLRHCRSSENQSKNIAKLDQILEAGTEAMIRVRDQFSQLDTEKKKFQAKRQKYQEKNNIIPFDYGGQLNV